MFSEADFPAVGRMDGVSLEEMSSVSLMNRTDTKFIATVPDLKGVLEDALKQGYRVLEISGNRLMPYKSVYYDTSDLRMFTDHRNGKKTRQKVRVRTYLVGGQTFLEVKRKNNRGRTRKKRMTVPESAAMNMACCPDAVDFLESRSAWNAGELSPETTTDFSRFTLVDPGMTERITVDLNLHFHNFRSGAEASLDELVIIELKQDGRNVSAMRGILLDHRVFPYRVSKYCIAVCLTDPSARPGRILEKVRHIEKKIGKRLMTNNL